MALKSPMMPSPSSGLMSAFSPYTDSPSSPRPFTSPMNSIPSESQSFLQPPHNPTSPNASSPSDIADPSPIAPSSNGTEVTDIEEGGMESGAEADDSESDTTPSLRPVESELKLETKQAAEDALNPRLDEDEQPNSVIHAPQGFDSFLRRSPPTARHSTPVPAPISEVNKHLTRPYSTNDAERTPPTRSPASPHAINTQVPPARDWSATPVAQTRSEAEAEAEDQQRSKSQQRIRDLEDIPEVRDAEQAEELTVQPTLFDETVEKFTETANEVAALKIALSECWTLCNTLAGLSYVHRERIFNFNGGEGDTQQQAWKSCWRLCQKLYETRDEDFDKQVRPTLDLCREFCQALFEVRLRGDELADSVLRVSFELNNHLYNTHDRQLPEAFRERTLDFYITLCHRLMKQRSHMAEETDSLLRACWSLAEMLFSLRQNKREGKPADEELLGSAVQACWELCDLFREGWTQVRPDRGTPRPSQTTFSQAFQQAKQSERSYTPSLVEESEDEDFGRNHPETPTTVFEDTQQLSPDDTEVPNILVLGPDPTSHRQQQQILQRTPPPPKWSSGASTLSDYAHSARSEKTTSSTSTIINPSEDPRLICLKLLIIKAAMNVGFQRSKSLSMASFVKSMPSNSFGTQPWQMSLLEKYKKLVASDPNFRSIGHSRRASARDVARSVMWMVSTGQYIWLKDLFRLVLGFHIEEAEVRGGVNVVS